MLATQSCLALCKPMDCSLPGFCVRGILQEKYLNGLPFPIPGDLPDPGTKPVSLASSELASGFFTTEPLRKPKKKTSTILISKGEE